MTALLDLNMVHMKCICLFFLSSFQKGLGNNPEQIEPPKPQEACRLGSAWQCALQLLQVTLVELSELQADVVSRQLVFF